MSDEARHAATRASSSFFTVELVVEPNYDGWRLDRYLTEKLRRATRSQVRRMIPRSVSLPDGRVAKPAARVRCGERVVLRRREHRDPGAPTLEDVSVIAADDALVVLDKPPGLLVHRTAREALFTVEAFLDARFPDETVSPAHRLDRDTAGILVCARHADVLRALHAQFARGDVDKLYRAIVLDPGERWTIGARQSIETPLGFDAGSEVRIRMGAGGLECATHVTCVDRSDDGRLAALDVAIEQGRQHQIRAHLAMAGTPVLGDKLYQLGNDFFLEWTKRPGADDLVAKLPTRWHCLHARAITLQIAGRRERFESPEPRHMTAAWRDAGENSAFRRSPPGQSEEP